MKESFNSMTLLLLLVSIKNTRPAACCTKLYRKRQLSLSPLPPPPLSRYEPQRFK